MRALVRLAFPISLSLLLQLATGIVATAVLGRLGELELAVGGLAMACLFTPLLIVNGVTSSVGISVAAADGAEDWTTAGACLRAGSLLAGLLALPVVVWLLSLPVLLGWLHYDPILVRASGGPLLVLSVAVVPLAVGNVFRQFFAAVLKPRVTVWAALAGLVAFMAAALPGLRVTDPSLGIFLVMLGYPVSAAVTLAVYVVAARAPEFQRYFVGRAPWSGCRTQVRQLFALGLPIGLSFAVESSVLGASSLLAARLGPAALAIHSLALQWVYISFVLAVGVSQATLIRVARANAQDGDAWTEPARHGVVLASALLGAMSMVSFGAPAIIAMALAPVLAGNALALSILRIAGVFQVLDGLQNLAAAICRGLEDTRTPLWAAILSFWPVGAGSAYALCFWAGLGLPGLWAGLCMGFATAGLLIVCSLARRRTGVLRARARA